MEQYRTHTYEHGNASIVVHRPILDDKERKKQEANLRLVMAAYGRAAAERAMEGDKRI